MTAITQLLAIAEAEVGYVEKANATQLDNKTANAGKANYTKYARDLDDVRFYNGQKQGYAWCAVFVDWCFVKAFGVDLALRMTGQNLGGYGAGCTESAKYYEGIGALYGYKTPRVGDQIFFTKDYGKTYYHTGIVRAVDETYVYTVEGNTSSGSGVDANGGMVAFKKYKLTNSLIGAYGRPDYSLMEDAMTGEDIINTLTNEQAYAILQKAQLHAATIKEPDWSVKEGLWAKALGAGIVSGSPEGLAKRDEVIAMLGRMGLLNDTEGA